MELCPPPSGRCPRWLDPLVSAWNCARDQMEAHPKAYGSISAARTDIADYLGWCNTQRAHASLDRSTPDEAYFAGLPQLKLAAQDELIRAPSREHVPVRFTHLGVL